MTLLRLAPAALLITSVACVRHLDTPAEEPARWTPAASMQHPRAAHAVVATKDAIYALAGTGDGGAPIMEVERFDGEQWSVETKLPGAGLNAPAAVMLRDQIYLLGGFNMTTNVPSDAVEVYDTKAHRWGFATPLPAPRGGHAAVVLDGRIHVLGGGNSETTLASHDVYDPETMTWDSLAPLPRSEGSPAAVIHRGKIYLMGGRSGPDDYGNVDIYDPVMNRWTPGPNIDPRGTAGAVVHEGMIYLIGGESQARSGCLGEVLRLGDEDQWKQLASMPTARNFARAVEFRDAVYVVGGSLTPMTSHASAGSAVVERFGR